jgi:hypothetical protein
MENTPVTLWSDIVISCILCVIGVLVFLFPEPIQRFAVWETKLLPKWLRVLPPEAYQSPCIRRQVQAVGLGLILTAFLVLRAAGETYATGHFVNPLAKLFRM